MNQGLALIVTLVGGVPSIVRPGENRLQIAVDDPGQLADAVPQLAVDPVLRERHVAAGRVLAAGNTPEQMACSYLDVYRAVLAGSPS